MRACRRLLGRDSRGALAAALLPPRPASRAPCSGWAPSADATSDRVLLTGLLFFARHGVLAAERSLGQRFAVDVALSLDTRVAGGTDDLDATVDYAKAYGVVAQAVAGAPPCALVEAVAHRTAAALLAAFPAAEGAHVRVTKPHVAVPGVVASLGARPAPNFRPERQTQTGPDRLRPPGPRARRRGGVQAEGRAEPAAHQVTRLGG